VLTTHVQEKGTKRNGMTSLAFKKISTMQADPSALLRIVWVQTLGANLRRRLGLTPQLPSHPGSCKLRLSHSANPSFLLPALSLSLFFLFRSKLQFLFLPLLPLWLHPRLHLRPKLLLKRTTLL
jgi:hypothetical protein